MPAFDSRRLPPAGTAAEPVRRHRVRSGASWTGACLAALLMIWTALVHSGLVPAARFARERIVVRVRPCEIEVDGLYVYENPLPVPWTQGLSVPFPADRRQPRPAAVRASLVSPGAERALPVLWASGPRFDVPLPASGEATVRVRFTQRAPDRHGTYLLTTTRPWGRPLDRGEYVVIPEGVRIAHQSLGEGLAAVRERFFPDADWTFEWTAEEPRCAD
ncbi:MAG: hypothetical protein QM765_21405 [Myxococcales bacterium]